MSRHGLVTVITILALATPGALHAAEIVGTLVLEEGSTISVDGTPALPIPAGSSLVFRFGEPAQDGTVPVTLAPSDVQISPVALPNGQRMHYTLGDIGRGTLKRAQGGLILDLNAKVRVGVAGKMGKEVRDYAILFTTENAIAVNDKGTSFKAIRGTRVSESSRSVKLVGGTTNAGDAVVSKGEAATVVLVGTFDRLPELAP